MQKREQEERKVFDPTLITILAGLLLLSAIFLFMEWSVNWNEDELRVIIQIRDIRNYLAKRRREIPEKEWLQKKYDVLYDTLYEIEEYITGEAEIRYDKK